MNREIKFRGFKKSWIYGGISIFQNEATIFDVNSVFQYTEVKDRNGVEIYEGDIVKGGSRIMQVFWQIEVCQFWLIWTDKNIGKYEPLTLNSAEYIEIIGNIYENPELLTK